MNENVENIIVSNFEYLNFDIVSDFVLRNSDFTVERRRPGAAAAGSR